MIVVKRIICITLFLSFGFRSPCQKIQSSHPNIILFLVDDMGWQDTSVPFWDTITNFNKRYHTPNMERLAREGMKFTNAYATPVCSPSRVSLMTGMNAAHSRVTNFTNPAQKNTTTDVADTTFNEVPWNVNGLSTFPNISRTVYATALPSLLRDAGYFTIHIGKGHFGPQGTSGANPGNLGFEVNVSGHAAGSPQSYLGKDNFGNLPEKTTFRAVPNLEEYYGTDTFLTEALTIEAIKKLDGPVHNRQPFFLYMAHYAVHVPLMGDDRYYQKYLDLGLSMPEAKYSSMIEGMDKSLGDILDYLKQQHLEKNTIVIFMSDNGGLALSPPRGGEPFTQNLPLKAGKGSVYEGGIREPMIVKWPGVTTPGSITKQNVIIEDFFPTILELAGVKNYKTVQKIDGVSFLAVLKNYKYNDTTHSLVWHYPNKWIPDGGPGINYASAMRKANWKIVYLMKDQRLELYNLKDDIREQENLAKIYPEKTLQMAHELTKKLKLWNAQMPFFQSTGRQVPWPDGTTNLAENHPR